MATQKPIDPPPYDRVRVLFPDHHGLARGKYLPLRSARRGTRNCITLFALDFDRTMVPAPGAMLLEGNPDVSVVFDMDDVRLGWEERTGVVVADLAFGGAPLPISPRTVLERAIADWKELGYRAMVGIELEAFVMEPDGRDGWREWTTPGAYVYGTGRAVDPVGLLDDIMRAAELAGLPIDSINSEYDTPQFELTLEYSDALEALDNVFMFKLLARETALHHGLLLTFMGKPFGDRGGSGLHVNMSMRDKRGRNAFADPKGEHGLSTVARQSIAGLLAHHEGMSAICAPTVNAYKRLRPGQLSGYWANWGKDHRSCTVRVPNERGEATRLEHRMPDGAANPYLATAAVLQAARLGVLNGAMPPGPETLDGFEQASTDRHIPENLSLALDALEADVEFCEAFGREAVDHFVFIKRNEWDKFAAAVTDWEIKHYLPFL
ncbi:MAG: glutamine synthetase family protein [Acidimicrobiia bacterium]